MPGDSAPWFRAAALEGAPAYSFDTVGGRHVLMLFFGSARFDRSRQALALVAANRGLFDDQGACFFGVTVDPEDSRQGRIRQELPGIRYFLDFGREVSTLYKAAAGDQYQPHWLLIDPALRVLERFPIEAGEAAITALKEQLAAEPSQPLWAPVLMVENVFEPELCERLIALYEQDGGEASGFMREIDGKTVLVHDPHHKQRRDYSVEDEQLRNALSARIRRRLSPAVTRAFQFTPTRMERYLVACYEPGAGHFRPHRDNTTKGTAHRQFAVTINLNADYEGGDLRFPEFGPRTYRAPVGGAIVFSCSLLHEATRVTEGRRFAFLPFLYNEEGARIREANNPHLGEGLEPYRMSTPAR
jgi:predicted 2-oxoglutarate/Fe(II)-dependent dioxygenase YbiX/peroxiredoxin